MFMTIILSLVFMEIPYFKRDSSIVFPSSKLEYQIITIRVALTFRALSTDAD